MNETWIVVADSDRARLFALSPDGRGLEEIEDLVNPEGRTPGRELVSDRPQRTFESSNSARHAMEPTTSPQEHAAEQFARQIAAELDHGLAEHRYEHLVLVAPPAFLGALHRIGDHHAWHELIAAELDKNLTKQDAAQIRAHLPERLPSAARARMRAQPGRALGNGT